MELFKLLGKIIIDWADADKALDDVSSKGENAKGKLSGAFSKIGGAAVKVGKTAAKGLAVGGAAMGTLTVKSMSLAGELEQNMGGSEAVFKEHATSMQNTAKEAYANMGLSTSDYLATANKMGALFQGAGFSVKESMTLSSDAMQRAADVASIMGIDTSSAMEAIAGAAKGNFTMMDNLGVAMNDTTLNAYAAAKGINKTTQEMTNQEKIGLAMEMFMEKTAYAAGNYAKENETLAGSLGTAKAALTNFLDGSGDVESLVSSFSNLANVIVNQLGELAPRLITGIVDVVNQVAPMLPPILQKVLPVLVKGAGDLIDGLVQALPSVLTALLDSAPILISALEQVIGSVISALPSLIESIVSALPSLLPQLITGVVSLIVLLCQNFGNIIQPIIDNLPDIIVSVVEAICQNLPILIDGLISLVLGIVSAIPQIIQSLTDAAPQVIEMVVTALLSALPQLLVGVGQLILGVAKALPTLLKNPIDLTINTLKGLWEAIKNIFSKVGEWFGGVWDSIGKNNPAIQNIKTYIENIFNAIKNVITTIFDAVKNTVMTVWNAIKNNISTVLDSIKNVFSTVWDSIKNVVSTVIDSIKNVISTVWEAIKTIIKNVMNIIFSVIKGDWTSAKESISNIVNAIKSVLSSVWNAIKNVIKSVMDGIKNTISSIWNGIKNTTKSVVDGIKNTISSVFNGIKNIAKSTWEGIKTAITTPIEKARDKIKEIIDKIKGFFANAKMEFPNIKLPHFGITPKGWKVSDLLEGSIPKLSIEWYAKAMKNPMVLNDPTVFGYNPATGSLMGGGEAGSEVVAGTSSLMQMIRGAVSGEISGVAYYLQQLIAMLADYFPELLAVAGHDVVLNDGALVGRLAPAIDVELGKISQMKGRGR